VNKAIEEKECETKRIRTIVNISKMLPQQVQFVKEETKQLMLALQLSKEDKLSLQQSLQHRNKLSRLKLQQDCQSFIKPAPLDDDPIITQFRPVTGQWELNEANIKRIDPQSGETILHNYSQHINTTPFRVFKYLIETKGGDITIQSNYLDTPIHLAFLHFNLHEGGDINTLLYLLNLEGVNVNFQGYNGCTILHYACRNVIGLSLDIFEYLIEIKGGDITIQSNYLNTPIHLAFHYFDSNEGGDINILEYLINLKDTDVNIKGQYHCTILHAASLHINILPLDIFKYLIETKGGDITIQSNYFNTPIHLAFGCFDSNKGGDINILKYLLNLEGVNVNKKDDDGNTILHSVFENINGLPLDIFKYLIETKGGDITIQSNYLDTPIHLAFLHFNLHEGGDINILKYLLNLEGVNVNKKGDDGRTILHYACRNVIGLSLDIFKYLIETKGGDITIQNDDNYSPIHDAFLHFNSSESVDISPLLYLLNLEDSDVNIKGRYGRTILHSACCNVNGISLEIFEYLIENKGLKIGCLDRQGNTPLHLLINNLSSKDDFTVSQIAEYLIQKGIPINHKNSEQLTVLGRLFKHSCAHPLTYGVLIKNGANLGKDC
jgi:ankyrin repeat protein